MRPLEEVPARRAWGRVAGVSDDLGARPLARTLLGLPLVLFRGDDGRPAALLDRCPHRNVPLSLGRVRGRRRSTARYHGWRFDGCGACRRGPGLAAPRRRTATARRGGPSFPVVERDGFVWVCAGAGDEPAARAAVRFAPVDAARLHDGAADRRGSRHAARHDRERARRAAHRVPAPRAVPGRREPVPRSGASVRRGRRRVEAEYVGEPRPPGLVARLLAPSGRRGRRTRPLPPAVDRAGRVPAGRAPPPGHVGLHARERLRDARPRHGHVPAAAARRGWCGPCHAGRRAASWARTPASSPRSPANVARFGGEQFASTPLDVLGPHVARMLRRLERGDPPPPTRPSRRTPPSPSWCDPIRGRRAPRGPLVAPDGGSGVGRTAARVRSVPAQDRGHPLRGPTARRAWPAPGRGRRRRLRKSRGGRMRPSKSEPIAAAPSPPTATTWARWATTSATVARRPGRARNPRCSDHAHHAAGVGHGPDLAVVEVAPHVAARPHAGVRRHHRPAPPVHGEGVGEGAGPGVGEVEDDAALAERLHVAPPLGGEPAVAPAGRRRCPQPRPGQVHEGDPRHDAEGGIGQVVGTDGVAALERHEAGQLSRGRGPAGSPPRRRRPRHRPPRGRAAAGPRWRGRPAAGPRRAGTGWWRCSSPPR